MHKSKILIDGSQRTLGVKLSPFRGKHKVFLDGRLLGEFTSNKEAKAGKEFKIDFNNFIKVKYTHSFLSPELHISHNDQELETSATHPKQIKKNAFGLIILLAALNLIIGSVGASGSLPALTQAGYGIYNLFMGMFYCVALLLFKSFNPFLGIILAFTLYSIDSVVVLMSLPSNPGISGAIVVRVMFFGFLIKGLAASYPEFRLSLVNSKK
jgi:hypothetical protein